MPGNLLKRADVDPGRLQHDICRNGRDLILVRIATGGNPVPHEILVEALGPLAFFKAFLIAFSKPVTAAVRRVDFISQNDLAIAINAEFIFRINEDEPTLRRDFLAAGKKRQRIAREGFPLLCRQQALFLFLCWKGNTVENSVSQSLRKI